MGLIDKFKNFIGIGGNRFTEAGNISSLRFGDVSLFNHEVSSISPGEALSVSTVFGCVQVISRYVGQTPCNLYKKDKESGRKELVVGGERYLTHLLRHNPTKITALDFKTSVAANLALCGNAYAEILKSDAGKSVGIRPIPFYDISVNKTKVRAQNAGDERYELQYNIHGDAIVKEKDMLHFKNINFDGILGLDSTAFAGRVIALAINLEKNSNNFFGNSSKPGGILKFASNVKDSSRDNFIKSWEEKHKGTENAHKIGIMPAGVEFEQLRDSNTNSQLVEHLDNVTLQITRFYGVPPHKVSMINSEPRANVVEANNDFVNTTIAFYCAIIADTLNEFFLTPAQKAEGLFFEFNTTKLLQGNLKDKAAAYRILAEFGAITRDELRKKFDFEPIGGDEGGEFLQAPNTPNTNTNEE